jgi:hypothetical protein
MSEENTIKIVSAQNHLTVDTLAQKRCLVKQGCRENAKHQRTVHPQYGTWLNLPFTMLFNGVYTNRLMRKDGETWLVVRKEAT